MADLGQPIIRKIIKKSGGGHHGGAWKVAYADFVTAMMAFFLLLWLLNSTTKEQQSGISNYFAPSSVSNTTSGSGGVMGGKSISEEMSMTSDGTPPLVPAEMEPGVEMSEDTVDASTAGSKGKGEGEADESRREHNKAATQAVEAKAFKELAQEIKEAVKNDKALAELAQNLHMEMTRDGLRIQLVDQEKRPMFASGQSAPLAHTAALLSKVAAVAAKVNNSLSISGHTDSSAFAGGGGYSNWELSADRANATRRLLVAKGVNPARIHAVNGMADRQPYIKANPAAPENRRISITLLYSSVAPSIGPTPAGGASTDAAPLLTDKPSAPIEDGVFRAEPAP
jgi:chemotaxis protein MotB